MAVEVKIAGKSLYTTSAYTVTEDASPVNAAENGGGTSQITAVVRVEPEWKSWRQKEFSLSDSSQGTTVGNISVPSSDGVNITVTADSRLAKLSVIRTAGPYQGTVRGALLYYMSLCGITTGFVVDDTISSNPVVIPGWEGNVWDFVNKQFCPALGLELSLVSNNIVLRPTRLRTAVNYRDSSIRESFDVGNLAQKVNIGYYNSRPIVNGPVYPPNGWNDEVTVYQVDANQIVVIDDIEIDASLTSIVQPECVLFVDVYDNTRSVYTVAGKDGLPIPPAQWRDTGGSIKVELNPDTRSFKLTITGPYLQEYSPYRIAVASSSSNYYSTLRLVGTGIAFKKETLELTTGYTADEAPTIVGADIDNEAVRTLEDAYRVGMWVAAAYGTPRHEISVTTTGINRAEDNGSYAYPTFGDFDKLNPGQTQAQFNTQWNGKGQTDFNKFWTERVSMDFANQAFGNIAGARVMHDNVWMRVRTATVTSGKNVQYTAQDDMIFKDLDDKGRGMTPAQFDAIWGVGAKFSDFDIEPLKGF